MPAPIDDQRMMSDEIVYFVHISDTHFGPTADYSRHGHYPAPCARRVIEIINDLGSQLKNISGL